MRHAEDFLSKQRQKLLQEAENKEREALRLELKPYLLPQERVSNCMQASIFRAEAKKCRAALSKLRHGTKRAQRAGWN